MKANMKPTLVLTLTAVMYGATAHVTAQSPSGGEENVSALDSSPTPVCENRNVNIQVKAALRLVCAQRESVQLSPFAQGLIVIGFLGGFAKSGDANHPEVWFGDYLRELYSSAAEISVMSNHQRRKAISEVLRLLDTDGDGILSAAEKAQAKIIVYGHSWGASEAATFARELEPLGIPVLLTVQIDIVAKLGQRPVLIPRNVEAAINFFQSEGPLHGRPEVVAEDPERTKILGNLHMSYEGHPVDCGNYPWFARTFNKPHHEVENDARVWQQIAAIIDSRLFSSTTSMDQAAIR
jgi:hypothetical protein